MQLEINGQIYDLYFGLDFLDYIENKHSPTMESDEGQKINVGVGGLAMLENKMNQYSPTALADVLVGATTTERKRLTRKQVEAYFSSIDDDEYFDLYEEVMNEMGKSTELRRAEKAQKRIQEKNRNNP